MQARRGKRALLLALGAGLLAAGGAAFAYRNALSERWHLWMLHSKDPANWQIAAERLGELRSARAVPRLIQLLRNLYPQNTDRRSPQPPPAPPDPHPYDAALLAIGRPATGALVEALGSSEENFRSTVDSILLGIGKPSVVPLAGTLGEKGEWRRTHVLDLLEKFGPLAREAIPALIGCLGDEYDRVRSGAAKVLAGFGKEAREAVPALVLNLKHEKPLVACAAARALGAIAPESAAQPLKASLERTEDPQCRIMFSFVLARIDPEDQSPIQTILKALEERYDSGSYGDQVRRLALEALAELGVDPGDK